MTPEVAAARQAVIDTRTKHRRREATLEELYAAADVYRGLIAAHFKARGIRSRPPSRAYLIRAL